MGEVGHCTPKRPNIKFAQYCLIVYNTTVRSIRVYLIGLVGFSSNSKLDRPAYRADLGISIYSGLLIARDYVSKIDYTRYTTECPLLKIWVYRRLGS